MENPVRTAEHVARITQRRNDLSKLLANLIPPSAPFVWEVGCGHGHFLAAYAAAHPEVLCIGVDITKDRIDRGLRKRDRAKLSNLHFIHAEAGVFLDSMPKKAVFSSIFVLFPDPWPKRRHHKNRIMQPEFLTAVSARAGDEARIYFRTDYEPYFQDTQTVLQDHPAWELVSESWPFEQKTVFESRANSHHSLVARRRTRRA
jgi:tRNA (guanine-N7-)-methyltransferase